MKKRNILLIGRTGSGKSTLANVLSGTSEFGESGLSTSRTENIKSIDFNHNGISYCIIDTIGIGDTAMEDNEVLLAIVKGCKMLKNGITQILFVEGSKFTQEEVNAYERIKKIFLDEITEYTTIVRTNFSAFKNPEKCEEDRRKLLEGNVKNVIVDMINSCGKRIIYVNNPSINIEDIENEQELSLNKNKREESRKILLNYLEKCQENYQPKVLESIDKEVNNKLIEEGESLQKELKKISKNLRELKKRERENKRTATRELLEELNRQREELKKERERIDKLIETNIELVEKGLFEALGRGLDKLIDKSLDAVIEVAQAFNKCNIS